MIEYKGKYGMDQGGQSILNDDPQIEISYL